MKKIIFLIILTAMFRLNSFAQEVITGLYENPVVKAEYESSFQERGLQRRTLT